MEVSRERSDSRGKMLAFLDSKKSRYYHGTVITGTGWNEGIGGGAGGGGGMAHWRTGTVIHEAFLLLPLHMMGTTHEDHSFNRRRVVHGLLQRLHVRVCCD